MSFSPKVSVIVVTFNHERFITQALESVLYQQCPFPIEVIISEDCSTDHTRSIVREYAARRPDLITLIESDQNIHSNYVLQRAIEAANGRYLAIMDGDDYWTKPFKLRRQVEFLDVHPECSLSFHDTLVVGKNNNELGASSVWAEMPTRLGMREILAGNHIPTCSVLVRRDSITPLPRWYEHAEYYDWPLWILTAKKGELAFSHEVMGARRVHASGAWTSLTKEQQVRGILRFLSQLDGDAEVRSASSLRVTKTVWELKLAMLEGRCDTIEAEEELREAFKADGTDDRLQSWYRYCLL
jgi:glycosyltransferase involved in cell wall biosynthesis